MEVYGAYKECIIRPCCSKLCDAREQEVRKKFYRKNDRFKKLPENLIGENWKEWKEYLSKFYYTQYMEYQNKGEVK